MIFFYRYSDKGKDPVDYGYNTTKKDCWYSFLNSFSKQKIVVVCDNCEKESLDFFKSDAFKIFDISVVETNLGNSKNAIFTYRYALKKFPEQNYYFCEDDYIHEGKFLPDLLEEALEYVDYCSLYDHGDKYKNYCGNPNPLLRGLGEQTELFRTDSSHWKLTNSTTMTFATKYDVLKKDIDFIEKFANMSIPRDFDMFMGLNKKGRTLATPIPSKSTHLSPDKDNLAPFFEI